MKDLLLTLKINTICNLSIWITAYLITVFVKWHFHNPFQWIIDIPKYSPEDRGFGLAGFIMWQTCQILIIHGIKPKK